MGSGGRGEPGPTRAGGPQVEAARFGGLRDRRQAMRVPLDGDRADRRSRIAPRGKESQGAGERRRCRARSAGREAGEPSGEDRFALGHSAIRFDLAGVADSPVSRAFALRARSLPTGESATLIVTRNPTEVGPNQASTPGPSGVSVPTGRCEPATNALRHSHGASIIDGSPVERQKPRSKDHSWTSWRAGHRSGAACFSSR